MVYHILLHIAIFKSIILIVFLQPVSLFSLSGMQDASYLVDSSRPHYIGMLFSTAAGDNIQEM